MRLADEHRRRVNLFSGEVVDIIPYGNITHYYKFENNVNDAVGSANGSAVGVSYADELIGKAIKLNGTDGSYFEISDNNDFSFADGSGDVARSISFIAKLTATGNQWLLGKDTGSNREWQLRLLNERVQFNLLDQFGTLGQISANSDIYNTTGQWVSIIVSKNNVPDETGIDIYINGINATNARTGNADYTQTRNTNSVIRCGNQTFNTTQRYSGYMDALAFWNVKLTPDESLAVATKNLSGQHLIT